MSNNERLKKCLEDYGFKLIGKFGDNPVIFQSGKHEFSVNRNGTIKALTEGTNVTIVNNGKGYLRLLSWNKFLKKSATIYVHRLVALCFNENPENLTDVNHINFDKSDNSSSNLEWSTRNYNMKHAWGGGRFEARQLSEEETRKEWVGKEVGTRKIIEVLDRQAKAGNYYVKVKCLICGNDDIIMCHNDFMKDKVKSCKKCRNRKKAS